MVKSVKVYLPFVCRAAALLSTVPLTGLTRLATFISPLVSEALALGSGAEVTVVVVEEVVGALADWVLERVGERLSVL